MHNLHATFFLLTAMCCGCAGPNFTDLGNGTGVPTESIDRHAADQGISREEAKKQILDQLNHP